MHVWTLVCMVPFFGAQSKVWNCVGYVGGTHPAREKTTWKYMGHLFGFQFNRLSTPVHVGNRSVSKKCAAEASWSLTSLVLHSLGVWQNEGAPLSVPSCKMLKIDLKHRGKNKNQRKAGICRPKVNRTINRSITYECGSINRALKRITNGCV